MDTKTGTDTQVIEKGQKVPKVVKKPRRRPQEIEAEESQTEKQKSYEAKKKKKVQKKTKSNVDKKDGYETAPGFTPDELEFLKKLRKEKSGKR